MANSHGTRSMLWVEHRQQLPHRCQDKAGERTEQQTLPVLVVCRQCRSFASVGPAHQLLDLAQVGWDAAVSVEQIVNHLQMWLLRSTSYHASSVLSHHYMSPAACRLPSQQPLRHEWADWNACISVEEMMPFVQGLQLKSGADLTG